MGLDSQAKSVTAHVEFEADSNTDVVEIKNLREAVQREFTDLEKFALTKTMERNR